jgi:hypothetical protein
VFSQSPIGALGTSFITVLEMLPVAFAMRVKSSCARSLFRNRDNRRNRDLQNARNEGIPLRHPDSRMSLEHLDHQNMSCNFRTPRRVCLFLLGKAG